MRYFCKKKNKTKITELYNLFIPFTPNPLGNNPYTKIKYIVKHKHDMVLHCQDTNQKVT